MDVKDVDESDQELLYAQTAELTQFKSHVILLIALCDTLLTVRSFQSFKRAPKGFAKALKTRSESQMKLIALR